MLNRDFSKSKLDYIKKNKISLIIGAVIILLGIIAMSIWQFNATVEFTGCNVVDINVNQELSKGEVDDYSKKINNVLISNGVNLYSVQVKGEGEWTTLEVKYTGKVSDNVVEKINAGFVNELDVELSDISLHKYLGKTVVAKDYIYTAVAILLILIIVTIFAIFRHNISYAMAILGSGVFSVLFLLSLYAILRLQVSPNFLFVLVGTMIYTVYESLILFETMRQINYEPEFKDKKEQHLVLAFKQNANRLQFTSIAMFAIGLVFVIFGTKVSRITAISFMFGIVVSLISLMFILPLIYNLTIDKVKLKTKKDKKNNDKEDKQTNSEVIQQQESVESNQENSETINNNLEETTVDERFTDNKESDENEKAVQ